MAKTNGRNYLKPNYTKIHDTKKSKNGSVDLEKYNKNEETRKK